MQIYSGCFNYQLANIKNLSAVLTLVSQLELTFPSSEVDFRHELIWAGSICFGRLWWYVFNLLVLCPDGFDLCGGEHFSSFRSVIKMAKYSHAIHKSVFSPSYLLDYTGSNTDNKTTTISYNDIKNSPFVNYLLFSQPLQV